MAVASCLALSGIPLAAHAAGLGKIVVLSALGQPLRAEIEVTATREELADMSAKLASPDTFKQAGLDYATTLLGIQFSLDKRSGGKPVIKLSSDRPINDPFVDLLLELNWATGRLVREYTFLLDPPEFAAKSAAAPVAPAIAKPGPAVRGSSRIEADVRDKALAAVRAKSDAKRVPEGTAAAVPEDFREVRRGDTLRKIAVETRPDGVSLDQMLVGLLRANQEAFENGNMNRLKAGKILKMPEKATVESVQDGEARKIVAAQSADWNAYRNKLAGVAAQTPEKDETASQQDSGKITAKVEESTAAAEEPKDQLKVSKTETGSGKPGETAKASDEDLIAKDKALKEANERLASLEQNVTDLQKLLDLKNQDLAAAQKQAAGTPAPAAAPAPAVPPSAEAPSPQAEQPTAADQPAAAQAAAPAVQPEPAPVPVPEKPVAQKPKPVAPPPPPPEEPGFIEGLLDNPMTLAGGGGILALLAAYLVARRRRAGQEEAKLDLSSTLTPQSSSLTANSVFRSTGGQSVDTSHTPAQTDFSQAGPGSIDTDEVDPVAEADVYMAYGRDAQAEEILLEAKQKDPKRYAIYLKLLEIYSNRKDVKQFEVLATDLYSETAGVGVEWEKAAAMGLKIDPGNPLFGAAARVTTAGFDADATVVVQPGAMKSSLSAPVESSQLASDASSSGTKATVEASPVVDEPDLTSLDFDLGQAEPEPERSAVSPLGNASAGAAPSLPEASSDATADATPLDFDFAADSTTTSPSTVKKGEENSVPFDFDLRSPGAAEVPVQEDNRAVADVDFDLGADTLSLPEKAVSTRKQLSEQSSALPKEDDVEFDVSLTESTFLGRSVPDSTSYDMSSIDLDLDVPEIQAQETSADQVQQMPDEKPAPDSAGMSFDSFQVSTAVNPDFDTEQAETIVAPKFGSDESEKDLMPEQDYFATQSETVVNQPPGMVPDRTSGRDSITEQSETVVNPQYGEEQDLLPEFDISASEEVATKLDLAKAYEEMGDFEGARELLQEVVKEGDAAQREKAQTILAKIGG
jgi:pilus assembly protein FimV